MLERYPVQKFYDDERLVAVFADLVDGADVGMVQSGSRTSFTSETFQCVRVSRKVFGQELQGDEAAELGVLGLVDHTHPAFGEKTHDSIMPGNNLIGLEGALAVGHALEGGDWV